MGSAGKLENIENLFWDLETSDPEVGLSPTGIATDFFKHAPHISAKILPDAFALVQATVNVNAVPPLDFIELCEAMLGHIPCHRDHQMTALLLAQMEVAATLVAKGDVRLSENTLKQIIRQGSIHSRYPRLHEILAELPRDSQFRIRMKFYRGSFENMISSTDSLTISGHHYLALIGGLASQDWRSFYGLAKGADIEAQLLAWLVEVIVNRQSSRFLPTSVRRKSYGDRLDSATQSMLDACLTLEKSTTSKDFLAIWALGSRTDLLPSVEAELLFLLAAAAITRKFGRVDVANALTDRYHQISMACSSGETPDLMVIQLQDLSQQFNSGLMKRVAAGARVSMQIVANLSLAKIRTLTRKQQTHADQYRQTKQQILKIFSDAAIDLQGAYGKLIQLGIALEIDPSIDISYNRDRVFSAHKIMSDKQLKATFKKHFPEGPEQLFGTWESVPFAGGAISQVHRADLPTGEKLAVKVRYPNVQSAVRHDFISLRLLAPFAKVMFPRLAIDKLLKRWEKQVLEETDFRREVHNMKRVKELFRDDPNVEVPQTYDDYCSPSVIAMEYIDGERISDLAKYADQERRNKIGIALMQSTFKMFQGAVFRADLHQGNYLITEDDRLIMLDFGMVIDDFDPKNCDFFGFLGSILSGESKVLREFLMRTDWVSDNDIPEESLSALISVMSQPFLDKEFKFTPSYAKKVVDLFLFEFGPYVDMPEGGFYIFRICGSMFGLLAMLNSEANWLTVAQPFMDPQLKNP